MISTLIYIGMGVAATAQFADAYTTYVGVHKKGMTESNSLAFIQWLVNKHPFLNMAVKAAVGASFGLIAIIGAHVATDISTILGLQLGSLAGLVASSWFGFSDAYKNHKA